MWKRAIVIGVLAVAGGLIFAGKAAAACPLEGQGQIGFAPGNQGILMSYGQAVNNPNNWGRGYLKQMKINNKGRNLNQPQFVGINPNRIPCKGDCGFAPRTNNIPCSKGCSNYPCFGCEQGNCANECNQSSCNGNNIGQENCGSGCVQLPCNGTSCDPGNRGSNLENYFPSNCGGLNIGGCNSN